MIKIVKTKSYLQDYSGEAELPPEERAFNSFASRTELQTQIKDSLLDGDSQIACIYKFVNYHTREAFLAGAKWAQENPNGT